MLLIFCVEIFGCELFFVGCFDGGLVLIGDCKLCGVFVVVFRFYKVFLCGVLWIGV